MANYKRQRLCFDNALGSSIEEMKSSRNEDKCGRPRPNSNESSLSDNDVSDYCSTNLYSWHIVESMEPNQYHFNETVGIKQNSSINEQSLEINFFEYFFDQFFMETVSDQTNKFYQGKKGKVDASQFSGKQLWHDTDTEELYVFLALTCLMPHMRKYRLQDYWSSEFLIETPSFRKYMSRNRYYLLLKYFSFNDYSPMIHQSQSSDHLLKIRPFLSHLKSKFSNIYNPGQKLAIDESFVLFRGQVIFQQYIPTQHERFGLKLFILCDCNTGLVLDFIFYPGIDIDYPSDHSLGHSGAIVNTLLANYLNKGHILYTDNWFTSPGLSNYLHVNKTGSCGTVKANRKYLPTFPTSEKGECHLMESKPILAIKWTDNGEVYMLTTIHSGRMESGKTACLTNEIKYKPDAVIDYNINKHLWVKTDVQSSTLDTNTKTLKWYKKMFFHLMDISLYNSYILYKEITKKKMSMSEFTLSLVSQLLTKYGRLSSPHHGRQSLIENFSDRLLSASYIERHHLAHVPSTGSRAIGQRRCHVCAYTTKRQKCEKRVSTWCPECKVGLCIKCFVIYHSCANY